jgi:hypothetical protein
VPFILCLGGVAYLQFRADPSLRDARPMLGQVAIFFDRHDFFKNMLGFGVLAFTTHLARRPGAGIVPASLLLGGLVALLELGQLWLPTRNCDWFDFLAGCAGIVVAGLAWRALAFRKP